MGCRHTGVTRPLRRLLLSRRSGTCARGRPLSVLVALGSLSATGTPHSWWGADETVDDGGIVDADVTADADTDVTADADTTANADGVVGAVPSALTPHDRQYIQVQVQLSIHVLECTDNQFSAMTTA